MINIYRLKRNTLKSKSYYKHQEEYIRLLDTQLQTTNQLLTQQGDLMRSIDREVMDIFLTRQGKQAKYTQLIDLYEQALENTLNRLIDHDQPRPQTNTTNSLDEYFDKA